MARITHRYDFPSRFVAGTVGEPGHRAFYLQAREDNRLTTVECEKEQVKILTEHLERILDELARMVGADIPPATEVSADLAPLDMPLEVEFRVGTMTLAWDTQADAVAIELFSASSDDEGQDLTDPDAEDVTETEERESVEVRLTPAQARDFIARSRALVAAGRPACPFCQQPMDPAGHICPRANGYRRPLFE